jgi:hypothetical protein
MRHPACWLALLCCSYSAAGGEQSLTGRMFLVLAHTDSIEPRFQVGRYGTQFLGADFVGLQPSQPIPIEHVFAGRMDDFYLNFGVYNMEDFLSSTKKPYYNGSFSYGDRGGHGWRPYTAAQLIRIMAASIPNR